MRAVVLEQAVVPDQLQTMPSRQHRLFTFIHSGLLTLNKGMKQSYKIFLILLTLLLPALLIQLGERPVYKIQEVRIAETAREMLESHDWIVPRYNGDLRLQKPPLPYWLTAVSFLLAGVNEFAARLPSVLFCLLSSLLLWSWSKREIGKKVAVYVLVVFVFSYIGLRYFRSGEADSMLLFFIIGSCKLGYDILHSRGSTRKKLLFGLMLGLGFLSKGPAALAIPLLTLCSFSLIQKRARQVTSSCSRFFSLPGALLLLITAFGWYLWILWQLPDIGQNFFTKQVDETFISGTHAKPVWWYLAHWFEFYAPWGVLLIPAGWMMYKQRNSLPSIVRFAWIWLGVVFLLLTATVNKQMQYALLFAPPLAIILAHYLVLAQGKFATINRILFWLFCAAVVLVAVIALRKFPPAPFHFVWLAFPLLPLLVRRMVSDSTLSVPVLLVASITAMVFLYSETYLAKEPRKIAAQTLMAEAAKYSPLYQPRTSLNDGTLSFYAKRVIPPIDDNEILHLLEQQTELWLVGEKLPELPHVFAHIELTVDNLKLYKLQKSH
jgi:hypothetical protein